MMGNFESSFHDNCAEFGGMPAVLQVGDLILNSRQPVYTSNDYDYEPQNNDHQYHRAFKDPRSSQDSRHSKKSHVSINRENEVTSFQDLVIAPRSNLKEMQSPAGQDKVKNLGLPPAPRITMLSGSGNVEHEEEKLSQKKLLHSSSTFKPKQSIQKRGIRSFTNYASVN